MPRCVPKFYGTRRGVTVTAANATERRGGTPVLPAVDRTNCNSNSTAAPSQAAAVGLFFGTGPTHPMPRVARLVLWALCVAAAAAGPHAAEEEALHLSAELTTRFQHWMTYHGKEYDSHDEKMARLQVWRANDGKAATGGCG